MSKKSIIAKLLSEEDISVVHKKTKTAAFNVESRELILPIWKEAMSKDISDLFICHEIGHALYTSKDMLQKMVDRKIDKSYVNIIEDARIERMVQDKYLGTKSCFTKGYNELLSKDFFGLKDKDLNDFNLADRINLHFKGVDNVPFSSVEQTWVDKVAKVKTEDEVLDLAQELMDFTDENEDSLGDNQEQQSQSSVGTDEGESLQDLRDDAKQIEDTLMTIIRVLVLMMRVMRVRTKHKLKVLVLKILTKKKRQKLVKRRVLVFKVGLDINILRLLIYHSISQLMMQWIRIVKIEFMRLSQR